MHAPVALGGVDHGQPVLALDAELVLRRLQVPLERVHTADVEPDILLQDTHMNPCSNKPEAQNGVQQTSTHSPRPLGSSLQRKPPSRNACSPPPIDPPDGDMWQQSVFHIIKVKVRGSEVPLA